MVCVHLWERIKNSERSDSLALKVLEAYARDVGCGIVRLDEDSMKVIKVKEGDFVQITGKRSIVGRCRLSYPSDEGRGIIRIDNIGRINANVEFGDTAIIRKIKPRAAKKVVLIPLETQDPPPIDERYLSDQLNEMPLVKGDKIPISYEGGTPTFEVIAFTPVADTVVVTDKTECFFVVNEILEGKSLLENGYYEEALTHFDNFLKSDTLQQSSMNLEATLYKGYALFLLDRYKEALSFYDEILKTDPQNLDALNRKWQALYEYGEFENALSALDEYLQYDPENIDVLFMKGKTLVFLKNRLEAVKCFQKILEINHDNRKAAGWLNFINNS